MYNKIKLIVNNGGKINMQSGLPYLDILIFGVIAVFLILRLKNILGSKTGYDSSNIELGKNHFAPLWNTVSLVPPRGPGGVGC